MLNKTALRNSAFLARIKAAIIVAVRESHAAHRSALGIGHAAVENAKGRFCMRVVWRRGGRGLECFDRDDNDVTSLVLAALNAWHAEQRMPPLMQVRELSPAEALREIMLHGNADALRRFIFRAGAASPATC